MFQNVTEFFVSCATVIRKLLDFNETISDVSLSNATKLHCLNRP